MGGSVGEHSDAGKDAAQDGLELTEQVIAGEDIVRQRK